MNDLLTIEKALYQQTDLEKLCANRELETEEIFKPNAYYGINYIFKTYTKLPFKQPLKVIFPHGIDLSSDFVWQVEKKALLPIIYYYSPHRYTAYKKATNKIILPTSSPFLILQNIIPPVKIKKEGTIFFLSHSTHFVESKSNFEKIYQNLLDLDKKFHPITICIYWRDFNLGRHKIFEKQGFNIVSAGHMFDKHFLFRLYHLCSKHKFAASNMLGTHLFYSIAAGCSFFFINTEKSTKEAPEEILHRDVSIPNAQIALKLKKLFSDQLDKPSNEQLDIVYKFLGKENFKKPSTLKKEFEFADKLDKYGMAVHPQTKQHYYRIPNLIPRKFLRKCKNNFFKENH